MRKMTTAIICLTLVSLSACAFKRANVLELTEKQQEYYADLTETLKDGQATLKLGLEQQVSANRESRLNIMRWERDLQKGEILLQVDADVTGNQRLLAEQLAQLNLESLSHFENVETTEKQVKTILELYDALIKSIEAVKKNNEIIITYLGSENKGFALRSLDIAGIANAIAGIRSVQESLSDIEERSEEQRQTERERVQSAIQRVRDTVLSALQAREGD